MNNNIGFNRCNKFDNQKEIIKAMVKTVHF